MFDWIPFAAGAVVLLWAVASFAFAASGGPSAGLHEAIAPDTHPERTRRLAQMRTFRRHQLLNYLLGLIVFAAMCALIVGTFTA